MFSIRLAGSSDLENLINLDPRSSTDAKRIPLITQAVRSGTCHLVEYTGQLIGYGVFEYSFYQNGFVAMLYFHPDFRRKHLGTRLMTYFEDICTTDKLFTSTNQSNIPMQRLLASMGYQPSGVIENLDDNDPELIYVKRLSR